MPLNDPIGSTSLDVLQRNAQDVDRFVNQTSGTVTNRTGTTITPLPVIEAGVQVKASEVNAASSSALIQIESNRLSVQTAADEAIAIEIPAQIARLGLEYPPSAYTDGLTLDSYTKTYSFDNALYIWGGELGVVTTGAFDEGDWQPIQGDIQLRDDVTKGTSLIRDVKSVASVSALRELPGRYDGQQVVLTSYFAGEGKGGGRAAWDANSEEADDGVVVFAVTGVAVGRWVRKLDGFINPEMIGGADNQEKLQKLLNVAAELGASVENLYAEVDYTELVFPQGMTVGECDLTLRYVGASATDTVVFDGGVRVKGAIRIKTEDDLTGESIGFARFASGPPTQVGTLELNGEQLSTNSTAVTVNNNMLKVGRFISKNFGRPIALVGADNAPLTGVEIDNVEIDTYIRGIALTHTQSTRFGNIFMTGVHPDASKSPGHNGILLSSAVDTYASKCVIEDAGEHSLRVGGNSSQAGAGNTKILNIPTFISRRSGGCGFKVNPNQGQLATQVHIGDLIGENTSRGEAGGNAELVRLTRCQDSSFNKVWDGWPDPNLGSGRSTRNTLRLNESSGLYFGDVISEANDNPMLSFGELTDSAQGGCFDITIDSISFFNKADPTELVRFDLNDFDLGGIFINRVNASGLSENPIAWRYGSGQLAGEIFVGGVIMGPSGLVDDPPQNDLAFLDIVLSGRRLIGPMYAASQRGSVNFDSGTFDNSNTPSVGLNVSSWHSTPGAGSYGGYISFSRPGSARRGAAIVVKQNTANANETGIVFCSRASVVGSDALSEQFEIDFNGDLGLMRNGRGYKIKSPNGTDYRIIVDNSGDLQVEPL